MQSINIRPSVYLCGTIAKGDPHFKRWREVATNALAYHGINALDPLRGKQDTDWSIDGIKVLNDDLPYAKGGFVDRDLYDVRRASAILLNMQVVPERQSVGTWFELGFARAHNKPVVVCASEPQIVDHPFVWKAAMRVVPTLLHALQCVTFLLADRDNPTLRLNGCVFSDEWFQNQSEDVKTVLMKRND